ncbi:unnamed protein product [Camellia sinensis]
MGTKKKRKKRRTRTNWELVLGVRDCIDNMWEEEEEQILERLRNQPIYSPPPSPTSVFLISPQLFFSQPPPLTPQPHFSPPPTTSVLMSPYLDFSAPSLFPNLRSLFRIELPPPRRQIIHIRVLELHEFFFSGRKVARNSSVTISDYAQDFGGAFDVILMFLDGNSEVAAAAAAAFETEICSLCVCEKEPDDIEEMTRTFVLESIPSGLFLPPKSPKMVSIWSCLSVVKISRKISIGLLQVLPSVQLPQTLHIVIVEEKMTRLLSCSGEFISQEERSVEITVEVDATNNGAHGVKAYENFPIVSHSEKKNTTDKLKRNYKSISVLTRENLEQHFGSSREDVANSFGVSERKKERLTEVISPSMHEKHDSRLRCIQKPLHARSSPRTIALLDGGEMVQLDSSKQQSLVEFDVTTNSAHLVKASQSCSTVSHLDETNSRETLKRKCTTENVLSFEDLQQHFGCKLDDAAKALGVSVSTVKRISRKHGIPRWPSHKKRKEKDVSSTCSQMPTDGQTERGNEMVGQLQDQNEGPNLLNTENGSNKESITTLIFEDSVPVFERDCILLEPQGEKNASPTHKTPTNGQTEVANGMVGHIRDQNGIVPEFIEGPNLSNIENRSNEKSLTTPNFQDSAPGNYPAMDFSISSTYRESGEASGSSELAFQPKELTPSTAYPNPDTCMFTQPHISLREMLIENVGSSKDSRNFPTSAMGFLTGGLVSESSWTMPLCSDQAPMQTMTTIPHTMPHLTEKQDIRTVTFKAQYRDKKIKFRLSLSSGIVELKKEVTNRLGELGIFEVHYQDNGNEWILIGCDTDVLDCFELSSSSGNEVVRLLVRD